MALIRSIFNACSKLQSLLDGNGRWTELIDSVSEHSNRTLEHIDIEDLHISNCLKIAKNLTLMPHLFHLSLGASAFLLLLRNHPKPFVDPDKHEEQEQESDANFRIPEQYLPSGIETLEVYGYRSAEERQAHGGMGLSESDIVINQLLKVVQRKKDKFPRLSNLCYVMFQSMDDIQMAFNRFDILFQENLSLLSRLGKENNITLHLSELDMKYCSSCKRREKSVEGGEVEPIPATEYSNYTGTDLTPEYCTEALKTKSVEEERAMLYEKHVLANSNS